MSVSKAEKKRLENNRLRREARKAKQNAPLAVAAEVAAFPEIQRTAANLGSTANQLVEVLASANECALRQDGFVRESSERMISAAIDLEQVVSELKNEKNQQQLHRRIKVVVEDKNGVLISSSTSDLAKDDRLQIVIAGDQLSATTTAAER